MSQELLFTSAPQGLNPNDQGFCTVVCTEGMPRNLKEFLESLSGYRHADQPPHPVNFSHLVHSVGGKRFHVLSRVGDHHKDYSGRTNKLAHHIALTVDELLPEGPAAILGTSLFRSSWDGQARWIPQGPPPPPVAASHGSCRTWEALAGDAGWAGLLAEASADGSNRPMSVIFSPGQDVLPLIREAMGLLPRDKAWSTSFSTYFTKLPAGVDCLWRFVLEGSPEAQLARAASHSRTIDLVELQRTRRQAPSGNPYVQAARAGRIVEPHAGTIAAPGSFSPSVAPTMTVPVFSDSAAPPRPFAASNAPASPFARSASAEQKSSKLPFILGGAAVVLLIGTLGLVYSMMQSRSVPSELAADSSKDRDRNTRSVSTIGEDQFLSPQEIARREAAARRAAERKTEPPIPNEQKPEKTNLPPTPKEPKVAIQVPWDKTLGTLDGYLILPPRNQKVGVVSTPEPTQLTQIHVADPREIDLSLASSNGNSQDIGREDSGLEGLMIRAEDEESDDGGRSRQWIVERKVIDPFTKLPRHANIAAFALADESLTFLWNMDAPDWAKANSLQYCVLEISNNDQSRRFRLSKPKSVPDSPYRLEGRDDEIDLAVSPNAVDEPDNLMLDLYLLGVGPEAMSKTELRIGETATFAIKADGIKTGDNRVEFDLTFQYDGKRPSIQINAYTFRKVLTTLNSRQQEEELKALGRYRDEAHTVPLEELRLSTIVSDFERIADSSQKIVKSLGSLRKLVTLEQMEIPRKKEQLSNLNGDLRAAIKDGDAKRQAELEKEIESVQKSLDEKLAVAKAYHERIDQLEAHIPWTQEMQPYFEKLGQTARVAYSLYITINGEKVFLAQTESAASIEQEGNIKENTEPKAKLDPKAKDNLKPMDEGNPNERARTNEEAKDGLKPNDPPRANDSSPKTGQSNRLPKAFKESDPC